MKIKAFCLSAIMALGVMASCNKPQEIPVLPSVNAGIPAEYKMEYTPAKKLVLGDLLCDGAMFQQNKPINVYGKGIVSQTVTATLLDGENTVSEASGIIGEDGSFVMQLPAMQATLKTYKLRVTSGETERIIKNVMIGDVYLAGGQSNMEFKLVNMYGSDDYLAENANGNIRMFQTQGLLYGSPDSPYPERPQMMLAKGEWVVGNQVGSISSASAVGFVFASELYKRLKAEGRETPIGIIDVSVGGTTAENWLGRQYATAEVEEGLKSIRKYPIDNWNEAGANNYTQYTAGFNTKLSAVRFASISGAIWYQGESNVFDSDLSVFEAVNENLLVQFSEMFGFKKGTMPFGFVLLANFSYSTTNLLLLPKVWDSQMKLTQSANARVSAVTTYDLPADGFDSPIHPIHKIEIGVRLADAIFASAYKKSYYSAPAAEACNFAGGKIKITAYSHGDLRYINDGVATGFEVVLGNGNVEAVGRDKITLSGSDIIIDVSGVVSEVRYNYNQNYKSGNVCDEKGQPLAPFSFKRV